MNRKINLIYFLMFLIGFNFRANAVIYVYIISIFSIIFFNFEKRITKNLFYVFLFFINVMISVLLYNLNQSVNNMIKYFSFVILYYSMYLFYKKLKDRYLDLENLIEIFFLQVFFFNLGNIFHMIGNVLLTDTESFNIGKRVVYDIWTRNSTPTTIMVGWGCLVVPTLIFSFEKRKKYKYKYLICIFLEIVYIFYSFKFATRLGIFNFILVLIFFFILKLIQKDLIMTKKGIFKVILLSLIICLFSGKIISFIQNSNLYIRMTKDSISFLNSTGRGEATLFLLLNFNKSFFGGEYFTNAYGLQQHNIIFQIYDLYGIIPFFIFLIIISKTIINTYKIFKHKKINNINKRFFILFFISLIAYLFEEPAFTSNFIIVEILFIYLAFSEIICKEKDWKIRSNYNNGKKY